MGKELRMDNGDVVDAVDCPECDGDVYLRGRLGMVECYVCANGHRFEWGDTDA